MSTFHGNCETELIKILNVKNREQLVPHCVAKSNKTARPGYGKVDASEFEDTDEVLEAKIQLLAQRLKRSKNAVVYTGAGISTSSGVDDYASQADDSAVRVKLSKDMASPFLAQPSDGHKALAQLFHKGVLKRWINQNHDGLAQKTGLPQHQINEIHGSWYDPSNPVVMMSGTLRPDLVSDLQEWEKKVDMVLALGTSLSGMTADGIAQRAAEKNGLVIVSLQRTTMDKVAAIRIFAKLDRVLTRLSQVMDATAPIPAPMAPVEEDDAVFTITRRRSDTSRASDDTSRASDDTSRASDDTSRASDGQVVEQMVEHQLDLRPDAVVYINGGPYHGAKGQVDGCNKEGHFNLRMWVVVNKKTGFKAPTPLKLGLWWVAEALDGKHIPIQNTPPRGKSRVE